MLAGRWVSLLPDICSFCKCVRLPRLSGSSVSMLPARLSSCRGYSYILHH